MALSYN